LRQRSFLDGLGVGGVFALKGWRERLSQAWLEFIESDQKLLEHSKTVKTPALNKETLRSIVDDVELTQEMNDNREAFFAAILAGEYGEDAEDAKRSLAKLFAEPRNGLVLACKC
jgi:hypothetical protein